MSAVGPLLTAPLQAELRAAARSGAPMMECSLDLHCSITTVTFVTDGWVWQDQRFPHVDACKERTVYYWSEGGFEPVARYTDALVKLIPTQWGPPTFEIDGIKMLPTAHISPYVDAQNKVALIEPRGKVVLDTCGGLGYFAAWSMLSEAKQVISYEKNPDVIWLRSLNPWSPKLSDKLTLTQGDIAELIERVPSHSIDGVLHDPPRFGIAGELYSQSFYDHLARVLKRQGKLFHYTGTPNKLTSGRDVPNEVAQRLRRAGFTAELVGDGVLAVKR